MFNSREKELMFVECLLNAKYYTRGRKTVKGLTVDISGSVGLKDFVGTIVMPI